MIKTIKFIFLALLSCCLSINHRLHADVQTKPKPTIIPALEEVKQPTRDNPDNNGPTSPSRVLPGEAPIHKNYWLPALEIPAFIALWNRFDRYAYPNTDYETTWASGWDHVKRGPWGIDNDPFAINQFGHPYQGTIYYGLARSSGLNFWESTLYTQAGSYIWETYGETTNPSINDQVASGVAGSFFGEALFRLSSLILEGGEEKNPSLWREISAGLVSPPSQFNRWIFGKDYGPILEHRGPAYFAQTRLGVGRNTKIKTQGSADTINHDVAAANFSLGYGLPGKPGYRYMRPLDYFHIEVAGLVERKRSFEDLMFRGLLFGRTYESGESLRGVWGLYGTYDYLSPQVFRVSTTAAQFGTTFQKWLSRKVALQTTALAGLGYGGAGTVVSVVPGEQGDYHYGLAPQSLVAARLIFAKRAMLDLTARGYYINSIGSNQSPGTEYIARIDSSFQVRVIKHQSVGVHYLITAREAHYKSTLDTRHQLVHTVLFAWTYLTDFSFGAVGWGRSES